MKQTAFILIFDFVYNHLEAFDETNTNKDVMICSIQDFFFHCHWLELFQYKQRVIIIVMVSSCIINSFKLRLAYFHMGM